MTELEDYPSDMIERRMNEMKGGAATKSDLLGLLLESNFEATKQGNESAGLSMQDIINECKLFYFAGHESVGLLLVWTTVMLSRHPKWQERAREEVFQVLGKDRAASYDDLSRLKIGSYSPPAPDITKITVEDTKLGDLTIPASVSITTIHREKAIYGPDAMEFNPERFFESYHNSQQTKSLNYGGGLMGAGPKWEKPRRGTWEAKGLVELGAHGK
ncbi:secologanin synthase 1-like [Rhododendron vialii]|uniref:secologanin synthase 1-like n=1 Tax=Rhododendron vialii TaxID=182163 RepID=UPI00265EBA5F|nr:secologanin synthase 1-like [Rhododendron vialii]